MVAFNIINKFVLLYRSEIRSFAQVDAFVRYKKFGGQISKVQYRSDKNRQKKEKRMCIENALKNSIGHFATTKKKIKNNETLCRSVWGP